ncbi:dihydrolipoamide acetyltransferase family protein [Mycolicibacterium sp.]|uniref:dihydrolipoamide acetyltransferase family protein n=1 Tax=Mycolicibacterium sp. TaxID=2320850 RepID=UPI003D0C7703
MSDRTFLLPDLGEGLTEAEISEWKVAVGDAVTTDQVVVEVETAKALVEVPIPFEGTVRTLHGAVGDTIEVGTPLITVAPTAEGRETASGNVLIGYGTAVAGPSRRRRARSTQPTPGRAAVGGPVPAARAVIAGAQGTSDRVISPVVRRLAAEHHIDMDAVSPMDPSGVVTRADIDRALAQTLVHDDAAPRHYGSDVGETRIPVKGVRKAVAERVSTSRREIPDATVWVDVDATVLLEARRTINAARPDSDGITLLALFARFAVAALVKFPELNSTFDGDEIVQFAQVHLGLAVQTHRGLVVPVIDHADALSTVELTHQIQDTVALAREGKLPPHRLYGGTFTLNNYGVFGVDGSTPIINYPEAAILGIGRLIDRPWVIGGGLAIRTIVQVGLTFDHRVCDGGAAAGFLRLFGDYVENPSAVLEEP